MDSILDTNATKARGEFWALQFGAYSRPGQFVFDVVFGILMPLLCFYLDPGIIQGNFSTPLQHVSIFIYVFSGLAIFALSLWLAFGRRFRFSADIFGGVLMAGAVCSFAIGIVILPLTLIGIFLVIGLLGLVPFLTGFVYLRNALRAINSGSALAAGSPRLVIIVLSAVVMMGLPGFAQWEANELVRQSITEILNPDRDASDTAVQRIKHLHWIVDTDRIVREYERESDGARGERLGKVYKEITGDKIEIRLRVLND